MNKMVDVGQIIAGHGRHYAVRCQDSSIVNCFPRGKRSEFVVGDWVNYQITGDQAGVIEALLPRRSLMYRSDQFKSKLFAANIDQVFVVVAVEPSFTTELIHRAIVAARVASEEGIPCHLILNKIDLTETVHQTLARLRPFEQLGSDVIATSVHQADTIDQLKHRLIGKTSLLFGQSGMGKSSLLNQLVPDAQAATQAISSVLDSGKHTTTFTRMYHLKDSDTKLIDSPGFQTFGLAHLSAEDLVNVFSEFHEPMGNCRFYNCQHLKEPGCGVLAALQRGEILSDRYQIYETLYRERHVKSY